MLSTTRGSSPLVELGSPGSTAASPAQSPGESQSSKKIQEEGRSWTTVAGAILLIGLFALGIVGLVVLSIRNGREPEHECPPKNPIVILVSMDGFRHDYINLTPLPNIMRLKEEGLYVKKLIPVFVSKTFPNHYTLVTGLYPETHGMVDNSFYDPDSRTSFSLRRPADNQNPYFWGGEPIWTTARKNGMIAACFFWPGSEVIDGDKSPNYFRAYDSSIPYQDRVDQVLAWLDLKEAERPNIITLYFDEPDKSGHRAGAASSDVIEALQDLDTVFGSLLDGISARNLDDQVSVVLLADHGMQNTTEKIYVDDYATIDLDKVVLEDGTTSALFYLKNSTDQDYFEELFLNLSTAHPNMTCYKREDIPEQFHYSQNRRIGDFGCFAGPTFLLQTRTEPYNLPGAHGYDNLNSDMAAIFMGKGPLFPKGRVVESMLNLNVYQLLCNLLGIEAAPNNATEPIDLYLKTC